MTAVAAAARSESVPTAAELVARVEELHPLLKKNAAAGEQDRRVVEESIQALTDAGMFKITIPKRYGGYETSMRTMLDVSAAVARADGGTAWVVTLVNICNWLVGLYPEKTQDEIFGSDPQAKVSGVLAPTATTRRVEGGWRVTGKWHYNSGSWHSTWATVGIPITDESGEVVDQGNALIPRGELGFEETWFVAGMRSSGSNTITADDIFVPDHRVLKVPAAIDGN
ncbi:MAG: acyl-CoA dehydrogenase family protein, partial [Pseudoclavibacter sp.]